MVGDDHRREAVLAGLGELVLDEGAVLAMAPSALVRCEQPVGGVAVADGAGEVRRGPTHLVVCPGLAEGARLEPEVRPQRRADEPHVLDGDGAPVEEGDAVVDALSGELAPPRLDVAPVVLVVTGHVEDAVRASPALGDVADPAGVHRGEVAGEDDELGAGGEWGVVFPSHST